MKILVYLLGLFALACAVRAEDKTGDTPADYAHALSLSVSGRQGVVAFRLPQAVYLNAETADLADLRLFDTLGRPLPFSLYQPPPLTHTQRQAWTVKRFPVQANPNTAQGTGSIALDFKTSPDGSLLSVRTRAKDAQPGPLAALVLDLGRPAQAPSPPVAALRFAPPPGRPSYSAQVWLEVSADFKQWQTIGASELSWLSAPTPGGEPADTLANDRLEFTPRRFRYARLTWRSGEPVDFAEVTAESVEQTADAPALERLDVQAVAGRQAEDWAYPASLAIPVEKIELRFNEPNVVVTAEVGTYRERPAHQLGKPSEWVFQALGRQVFYQITQDGELRRSEAWPVAASHFAEWVVRPQTPSTGKPGLTLIWQPATLVFLAGGQPPYTLAFGRADAKPAALALNQVAPGFSVEELAKLEQAQAGPLQTRAETATGPSAAAQASAAARRRRVILWAVLLAGLAALGAMVWRLYRQMRQG